MKILNLTNTKGVLKALPFLDILVDNQEVQKYILINGKQFDIVEYEKFKKSLDNDFDV